MYEKPIHDFYHCLTKMDGVSLWHERFFIHEFNLER